MKSVFAVITACLLVHSVAHAGPNAGKKQINPNPWAKAEASFAAHVAPLLKQLRTRLSDSSIQYAEVRSDLFRKFLPNHRVFAQDSNINLAGTNSTFILARDGKIVDLGDTVLTGRDNIMRVQSIADFIKSLGIKVTSAKDANEVARLFEEIQSANSYVSYLRAKTKNYTVFDRRFISKLGSRRKNWKYSAKGRDKTWVVSVSYVGPPTSIREPPIYQINLDATGAFKDIYIIAPGAEL